MSMSNSSDLFSKIRKHFGEYAVDKKLASEYELAKLPRYVAEFLIAEFSQEHRDKDKDKDEWYKEVRDLISKHYYEPEEKEVVKHELTKNGKVKLIDELRVYVDINSGTHMGLIPSLNLVAIVPMDIADRFKNVLINGIWGLISLAITDTGDSNGKQVQLTDFQPFQVPDTDPGLFKEARKHFTFDEWLDTLINTIGLDPTMYGRRQKVLLIARLVSLAESNVNITEFGPKATGKTYMLRNVSNYVRIISGGTISPATLFYNLRTKVPGEIAMKDLVAFDEVSKVRFANPDEMVGKLKDYMDSMQYERGDKKVASDAGIAFLGNVQVEKKHEGGGYIPVEDLTYVLPEAMRDTALIDRIHALIPGWEMPKIQQSKYHLSKGYGIASDYFAEIMHIIRKDTMQGMVKDFVELSNNFTIRDEKALKRVASGMLKLLFPDGNIDRGDLQYVMDIVLEFRQRIRDWLFKIAPGEFSNDKLSIRIK